MTDNRPLVSVIMVTYNSSRYVSESLRSILNQSYTNFELIIGDDNSTDNSWEIINTYHDTRIRKYRNEHNIGEYPNRNLAVSLAKGEYLIFIDGDDILYPYGLDFIMQFAIVYADCAMVIARPWDERIIYPKRISPYQFYCFEFLDHGILGINFTKVLFKTVHIQNMPFPDNVKLGDVYIQYLLAREFDAVIIPDASTWWRRNSGQASEKLLTDYSFYLIHELWIKLSMIQAEMCPLAAIEKQRALSNIYGNYLRYLLKLVFSVKFGKAFKLYKRYPVNLKYWAALIKPQYRSYMKDKYADLPLKN